MKNIALLSLLLTFCFAQAAEEKSDVGEFKVYVNSFDEDVDLSTIKDEKIVTKSGVVAVKSQTRNLPDPRTMDAMFKKAGFGSEVLDMDQMDKDIFFLKVEKKPMSYLLEKYPNMEERKIKKLKKLVGSKV